MWERKKETERDDKCRSNEAVTPYFSIIQYAEVSFCGADATLLALFYFRAKTVSVIMSVIMLKYL